MKRVCIIGCGSIGSLYAAHLAGVTEVWAFVRRAEHARALNQDGLRVSGTHELHARLRATNEDRKSTRLNSSHGYISYAVFCLKKNITAETTMTLAEVVFIMLGVGFGAILLSRSADVLVPSLLGLGLLGFGVWLFLAVQRFGLF